MLDGAFIGSEGSRFPRHHCYAHQAARTETHSSDQSSAAASSPLSSTAKKKDSFCMYTPPCWLLGKNNSRIFTCSNFCRSKPRDWNWKNRLKSFDLDTKMQNLLPGLHNNRQLLDKDRPDLVWPPGVHQHHRQQPRGFTSLVTVKCDWINLWKWPFGLCYISILFTSWVAPGSPQHHTTASSILQVMGSKGDVRYAFPDDQRFHVGHKHCQFLTPTTPHDENLLEQYYY